MRSRITVHIFQRLTLNDILWVHNQRSWVHKIEESQYVGRGNKFYYFAIKLKRNNIEYHISQGWGLQNNVACFIIFHVCRIIETLCTYWILPFFRCVCPAYLHRHLSNMNVFLSIQQALVLPHGEIQHEVLKGFHAVPQHDDVIKWRHSPGYWPFVRGIHQSPVNSPHKDHWRGAWMFSLIYAWTNGLTNIRDAGDLRYHCAHYDVIVMNALYCSITNIFVKCRQETGNK